LIISASRRTDIPAFYSDWFLRRLAAGFVLVPNPFFPQQLRRVDLAPEAVDCIVFWTKNPGPLLPRLDSLAGYCYYFHFTLNPYGPRIETALPEQPELIATFQALSERIGRERVVWRYDPILFSAAHGLNYHLEQFARLAERLGPYTERCVISFLDFYEKTVRNMAAVAPYDPGDAQLAELAAGLARIARDHGLVLETCCERLDLDAIGIRHGRCIDDRLIARLSPKPVRFRKASGQREGCGCVASVDIGVYNTCRHDCLYCYANQNRTRVAQRTAAYDPDAPLLCGSANPAQTPFQTVSDAPGHPQLKLFE
jgi:hypothetical protein